MIFEQLKLKEICSSISDGDHQAPPKVTKGVRVCNNFQHYEYKPIRFSNTMFVPQEY